MFVHQLSNPSKTPSLPKAIHNNSPVKGILQEIGSWVTGSPFSSFILSNICSGPGRKCQRQGSTLGISVSKAVATQKHILGDAEDV